MCGAVSARRRRSAAWHAGHSFSLIFFVCAVLLGEARQDCFSQFNADADVVWLQVALPYYWGMQLQIPRCLIMVG